MPLAGRPMIEWSLDAFRAAGVGAIVVAVPPGEPDVSLSVAQGSTSIATVLGGATRAESVANALDAVETDLVAIHDAARPLVTPELIAGVVETLAADAEASGAVAACPVTDTIKRARRRVDGSPPESAAKGSAEVEETVERNDLWAAQTPQVFRTAALREAIAATPDGYVPTDESALLERIGGRVLIHESSAENLKVTTPVDLDLAALLLERT